jgi:hypothetical protein
MGSVRSIASRASVAAAALTACIGSLHAEPTPTVNALMNQNVSLFSYGLQRLDARLDRVFEKDGGFAGVKYDWDRNRITLSYLNFDSPCATLSRDACEALCRKQLDRLIQTVCFGKNCETLSFFGNYFAHYGFTKKDVLQKKSDAELAATLKDITFAEARLVYKPGRTQYCTMGVDLEPTFRVDTDAK